MSLLADYAERYTGIRFTRDAYGVLEMVMHTGERRRNGASPLRPSTPSWAMPLPMWRATRKTGSSAPAKQHNTDL